LRNDEKTAADILPISVIDDDESVRQSLVELLATFGYRVHAFPSARNFLLFDELRNYSCIVSDVKMRDMTGFDLIDALWERNIQTPVVLITAFRDEKAVARAKSAGIPILMKPFEAHDLIACIEKASSG
jgi:FixJ family two-component response regulator